MKTISILAFLLLSMNSFCQTTAGNDSIIPVIEDNRVTIWDMDARRNCGSDYTMELQRNYNQFSWIQRDMGDYAYCDCNFDYSITFGPLEPGYYGVDVYYTEPEDSTLFYVGYTSFSIESPMPDSLSFFQQFISNCGGINLNQKDLIKGKAPGLGQNHPNPFIRYTIIPLTSIPAGNPDLILCNALGTIIWRIPLNPGAQEIRIDRDLSPGQPLPAGIYYYGVESAQPAGFHKMVVMD